MGTGIQVRKLPAIDEDNAYQVALVYAYTILGVFLYRKGRL